MVADIRPVTPEELRRAEFKSALRGYSPEQVREILSRAAIAIEGLIADPAGAATVGAIAARELRAAAIAAQFRGDNRDEVNDFCERAAATIDSLQAVARSGDGGSDEVVALISASVTSAQLAPLVADPVAETVAPFVAAPIAGTVAARVADPIAVGEQCADASVVRSTTATSFVGSGNAERALDRESVRVGLGARSYHIVIGTDLAGAAVSAARAHGARRAVIVTQSSVRQRAEVYAQALLDAEIPATVMLIDDGEPAKSFATVERLCQAMSGWGLLRGDVVLAVGGGVVGDTAGFAASIYYRGVAVIQIPTTLLAMVDAAIGGKTAVNIPQGKNLVGAFHQPIAVLCDPAALGSLNDRDFRCGLGEVLKYALMGDEELLGIVSQHSQLLIARDPEVLRRAISRSAAVKARFVSADELERTGLREHLNYGHTLAHAIETAADHALAHGEAVAVGLVFAGALAGALERISRADADRHRQLALDLGLPVTVPPDITRAELVALMARDKKAVGGLRFVLQGPNGLERVDDPPISALDAAFAAVGVRA